MLTDELLSEIVEWDVNTWKHAVLFWDDIIKRKDPEPSSRKVLDLGARNGGVSLYFALQGMECVCSDLGGPSAKADLLHTKYGVKERVSYADVNCSDIAYPDESFDIVAFKSVMGAVGRENNDDNIRQAFSEIYRVLKPGGTLFFAENLEATWLHKFCRTHLVKWGKAWNYLSLAFVEELLKPFAANDVRTYGILSCFLKDRWITRKFDEICCQSQKSTTHYICFGYALK